MKNNQTNAIYGVLVLLALIWGSSYILMKKGLMHFAPTQVTALRFVFAMVGLSPFLFKSFKGLRKADVPLLTVVALLGTGIPAFIYPIVINNLGKSALVGIINSLTPVFTLLFGILFFGVASGRNKILGVILGFLGALVLVLSNGSASQFNWYILVAILAPICYGISTNIIKSKLPHVNALSLTALIFLVNGIIGVVILLSSNFIEVVTTNHESWKSVGYIFILGFVGTAFALGMFNYLIQRTSALLASSVTYLMPVIAIVWGLLDKEKIGVFHVIGMLLILFGVYLISLKAKKSAKA